MRDPNVLSGYANKKPQDFVEHPQDFPRQSDITQLFASFCKIKQGLKWKRAFQENTCQMKDFKKTVIWCSSREFGTSFNGKGGKICCPGCRQQALPAVQAAGPCQMPTPPLPSPGSHHPNNSNFQEWACSRGSETWQGIALTLTPFLRKHDCFFKWDCFLEWHHKRSTCVC